MIIKDQIYEKLIAGFEAKKADSYDKLFIKYRRNKGSFYAAAAEAFSTDKGAVLTRALYSDLILFF